MLKDDLVGTWILVDFLIAPNGESFEPWRKRQSGMLIYTKQLTMSVAINGDTDHGNHLDEVLFYSGTYQIESKNLVLHHVDLATDFSKLGQTLEREVQLEGDRLTLTGRGEFGVAKVTWKRLPTPA